MCGIVGYIGRKNNACNILIDGLKNLEYRGYDSAGIAYRKDNEIITIKREGSIKNLEDEVNLDECTSIGIGHTRWATHGKPSEINSHPHTSGNITIVHNGIIENYLEIKNNLLKKGVTFKSETDTEVAAALLNDLYNDKCDMITAIREFKRQVKGSYALCILVKNLEDDIYIVKNASPLIIGTAKDGYYIASDVPAILKYTNEYVLLEDGEYGKVTKNSLTLYDNNDKEKKYKTIKFDGDELSIDKKGYEHFMLKEIHEEPTIIKNLISKYKNDLNALPDLSKYKDIIIVACGSAMHAGLVGKYIIEEKMNIPVTVEIASEFRYKKLFLTESSLVIAISQSGETADTLAAVKIAKEHKAHTLGIVNVKESSIAREVDEVVYTEAGSEIAVATTKAYLAQITILILLGIRNANEDLSNLDKLPVLLDSLINNNHYLEIAKKIYKDENIFFIGRLIDYALCMESSLKLKEISYIHSDCYAAGELKHGTISLIDKDTKVIAFVTDKKIAEKTISNIKEVKARGAYVILIATEDIDIDGDFYDDKVIIPYVDDYTKSILSIVPAQLIAYEVAKLRECSIDKPKNLAKSVTVE